MLRKIIKFITIMNIIFQIIFLTVGSLKTSEMGILKYVFYIFRPEYMVISGIAAFVVLCTDLILIIASIIKSRKIINFFDVVILILNIEYIIFYIDFLSKQ